MKSIVWHIRNIKFSISNKLSGLGVLGTEAYDVCKRCNMSYVMSRLHDINRNIHKDPFQRIAFDRDDSDELEEDYMQKSNEKENEKQHLDRDNRNLMPEYRGLCEIVSQRVQLDDSEYEYQPPHYHEIYCKNFASLGNNQHSANPYKQKCVNSVFHCVQRSKILFFVRRRWDSECWEPYVKEIASGCDCMRPVSDLEEITRSY